MKTASHRPDILEGPLFRNILLFAIPLMLTNVLQSLYNSADMIVVGYSGVEGALGAIGTTAALNHMVLNIFVGFSVGATVVVARRIGAKDVDGTGVAVHTALCISVIFGMLACVVGQLLCRPVLTLLGDEGRILNLAVTYCRLVFGGAPLQALTNFCCAIFRAKGDTKKPLIVLTCSGIFNVLMNMFFVFVCGLSVEGVALATIMSNGLSAAVLLRLLSGDEGWCRFSFRRLRICKETFLEILKIGLPAGIQSAIYSVSNMVIQSSVIGINNSLFPGGSAVLDGNSAASSVENFVNVLKAAVGQAAVTFASQHVGAKKYERIGKVAANCYLCTFLVTMGSSALFLLFSKPMLSLYVHTPEAMHFAQLRLRIMLSTCFTLALMDTGTGLLRGLGKSMTATMISLLGTCALRVFWILAVFPHFGTLECVYYSYPLSWTLSAVVSAAYFLFFWKKLLRRQEPVCA